VQHQVFGEHFEVDVAEDRELVHGVHELVEEAAGVGAGFIEAGGYAGAEEGHRVLDPVDHGVA